MPYEHEQGSLVKDVSKKSWESTFDDLPLKANCLTYLKAVLVSFASIYPFYAVVSQLSALDHDSFVPCNGHSCHYLRIFGSKELPGSGVDIVQIENGISRPVQMHIIPHVVMIAHTASYKNETKHKDLEEFLAKHNRVSDAVADETEAAENIPWRTWFSLVWCKAIVKAFVSPFNLVSHSMSPKHWGISDIPSALCPDMTKDQMMKKCESVEVKSYIINFMDAGLSKTIYMFGLFGWAVAKAVHDCSLMSGCVPEAYTLYIGYCSAFCQGFAVVAIFFWAMGASEVFSAPLEHGSSSCACYYQLPETAALFALATPMMLLITFLGKVQSMGMSALYGDYVYMNRYDVPFYLVQQTPRWTWGTLITRNVVGTTMNAENHRAQMKEFHYRLLYRLQSFLWFFRLATMNIPVALGSMTAIVRYKELGQAYAKSKAWRGMVESTLLKIILTAPAIFSIGMGCWLAYQCYKYAKKLGEQLDGYSKHRQRSHSLGNVKHEMVLVGEGVKGFLQRNPIIRYILMCAIGFLLLVTCCCAGQGLAPDFQFVLFNKPPRHPSLIQAELWSTCGFVFMTLPLQRCFSEIFLVNEDLALLARKAWPEDSLKEDDPAE